MEHKSAPKHHDAPVADYRMPIAVAGLALLVGVSAVEYTLRQMPADKRPTTYASGCLWENSFSEDRNVNTTAAIAGIGTAVYFTFRRRS